MLQSFYLNQTSSGLTYAGLSLFNPYKHFGQSTLWPRGFPLAAVGSPQEAVYRLSDDWDTPLIQQGVVNGDPDMDAIFRLTRKRTTTPLDVHFDPKAPPVFLPEGVFSPFNSQNTLFHYSAMWALLLPTTTTFRMCDIWRGYWAQRLLWEIGGHLGFFPPNAYQTRNSHSYMADAEDEKDMYFDTDRLLDFLTSWKCPHELSFFQCVHKLSSDMAKDSFWAEEDVEITRLWLEDLIKSGYPEPSRVNVTSAFSQLSPVEQKIVKKMSRAIPRHNTQAAEENQPSELDLKWAVTTRRGSYVYFVAVEQEPPSVLTSPERQQDREGRVSRHLSQVAALCTAIPAFTTRTDLINSHKTSAFHDVLLIVTFNWPFYENVRYIEIMHRNLFPNIVYCGVQAEKFARDTKDIGRELSFIEAPIVYGHRGYRCTINAIQMAYNVTGYLAVGDDVILNTWKFRDLDKQKLWMTKPSIFSCQTGTNWYWWDRPGGKTELTNAMASLRSKSETAATATGEPDIRAFFSQLQTNTGPNNGCLHGLSDVYFIPRHLSSRVTFYLKHFAAHNIMLELAVPMTLQGMQSRENIIILPSTNLWLQNRLNPWIHYSPDIYLLHPVKFSNLTNLAPLCSLHLTQLLLRSYI
ncbi:uncharacterized protein LOC118478424 [Aplysia californica]|uniref:Uncharacterized protein LOC118478424 n=1 Tax=Aplysia californica TaxID=6500 RepID=A0ABM1VZR0_APLCA|nr:uncharacterized protein LOC118478424 [Aplysia californica]